MNTQHVAVIVPGLSKSGIVAGMESQAINLANTYARTDLQVDFVHINLSGVEHTQNNYEQLLNDRIRCFDLDLSTSPEETNFLDTMRYGIPLDDKSTLSSLSVPSIRKYLIEGRPDSIITYHRLSGTAVQAALDFSPISLNAIRHIIYEVNSYSNFDPSISKYGNYYKNLITNFYPHADTIIMQCKDMEKSLEKFTSSTFNNTRIIYNPVIDHKALERYDEICPHKWIHPDLRENIQTIVGVGRLGYQKNFETLIHAFSLVHKERSNTRLLLLGEGGLRKELEQLIATLNLSEVVQMPGNVDNPLMYMKHASLVVSSSLFEGLQGSLIEALGSGAKLVATDCETGAREILEDGRFGILVPVLEVSTMAQAILFQLDNIEEEDLISERKESALKRFSNSIYKAYFDFL